MIKRGNKTYFEYKELSAYGQHAVQDRRCESIRVNGKTYYYV